MRVLAVGNMYPPLHLGGYELVWRSAIDHLGDLGWRTRVLTTEYRADDAPPDEQDVFRTLRWYWHDHEFPRLPILERLRLERHNQRVLDQHLDDFEPDVVTWWAMGGMSMAMIGQVSDRDIGAAGLVLDDWMVYGPSVDQWQRASRRLGRFARVLPALAGLSVPDYSSAARWAFISETTRRHAEDSLGVLEGACVVSPGINPGLFSPREPKPWSWRLLVPGRLDERKGIHVAIEALAHLPSATLVLDGPGDDGYRRRLDALITDLGLTERVRFAHSARADLPARYAEADAVLFPVIWEEPWGLVPLEAMRVGRPVVATGAGGSGEYLRDEHNCLLVPKDDAVALASAVDRLAADSEMREQLRRGGALTSQMYTEAKFNQAVAELISEVARSGQVGDKSASTAAATSSPSRTE